MNRQRLGTIVNAILAIAIALSILFAVLWFVWPTPWRYEHSTVLGRSTLVRVNRITDETQVLMPYQGWRTWGSTP